MAIDYDLWKTTPPEEYTASDWIEDKDITEVIGDALANEILYDLMAGVGLEKLSNRLYEAVEKEFEKAMQDTRDYDGVESDDFF